MPRSRTVLQFRVSDEVHNRLDQLRRERHLNVSAWAREAVLAALERDFPEETASAAPTPPPNAAPLKGWKPARLPDGGWGAAFEGDVAALPERLEGCQIAVVPRHGSAWTTIVDQVLERGSRRVVVRDSGRSSKGASDT